MKNKEKKKECPFTHPQITREYPNKETHKLCNDDTEFSPASMPQPITGTN